MIKPSVVTSVVSLLLMLLAPTVGRSEPAQPNAAGDYDSNEGYQLAHLPLNSPGYLWRVVSPGLSCRAEANSKSSIVRQFRQGQVLQANVGRGGSDEVLRNAKDADGKPWMWVRSAAGQNYHCYVRANRKYITPVSSPRGARP